MFAVCENLKLKIGLYLSDSWCLISSTFCDSCSMVTYAGTVYVLMYSLCMLRQFRGLQLRDEVRGYVRVNVRDMVISRSHFKCLDISVKCKQKYGNLLLKAKCLHVSNSDPS